MLNNRGQVLVFYILLIPIFLIILVLVIDIGNVSYQKKAINNICNLIEEDIDKINNIEEYVKLNDNNIKVKIENNNLILEKKVEGILSHIINIDSFDIKVYCNIERNN